MLKEYISCNDVLLVPRYSDLSSRSECDISQNFNVNNKVLTYNYPIIAAPMDMVYSKELGDKLNVNKIPYVVHRYFKNSITQIEASCDNNNYQFFAVGSIIKKSNIEWINNLINYGITNFCIDMAHGDSKGCVDTIKYIKENNPNSIIMAGNIATRSGFARLEEAGADMIRCGVGSGQSCSTRNQTGFGVPLLSCIEDCYKVKDRALIIADGGMSKIGDIAKAISFGADLCMSGKMFAATDLAPGDCYDINKELLCDYKYFIENNDINIKYKEYRGMASAEARKGVLKEASIEGESGLIPYYGTTEKFLIDLQQNLQASLSYAGAKNWNVFKRMVKKIRVSNGAYIENQTHIVNKKT